MSTAATTKRPAPLNDDEGDLLDNDDHPSSSSRPTKQRILSPASSSATIPKSTARTATSTPTLATWLDLPAPKVPSPLLSSAPITDRQSTFIAFAAPATSQNQAVALQTYVRALIDSKSHPEAADHEMLAWRILAPKPGKSGLGGEEDWGPKSGIDDDGEKNGAGVIRKVLEELAVIDVACVVSRYYGGIMLGPARFDHIRAVAKQAITSLQATLALPPLLSELRDLDNEITIMLPADKPPPPTPNYDKLTVETAERLILARKKRLELLEKMAGEKKDVIEKETPPGEGDVEAESEAPAAGDIAG